ncbi:uncharacterized protein LOC107213130 isoform X2 [Parus major]|uniref:uncharacterized protein LOC107213130 isoform X2 n=1 Tax=Parus major TaxID=9157 RepID=UPI0007713312|nr:uncharacterized protein LOC107213130 isoform X2 [Parus major]
MLLQSSAWDILSIPHPEAPVLLPLTGPGRTQSRSLSRAQSSLSVPAGPGGGVPAGRCPVALPGPRPPRTDTKALTSRSAPFPVPLASPFPSQSLGRTHGCGSRSAPVPAAKSRPAAALGNFQPDDAGTYYCVKFIKGKTGEDEVFQHGSGTEVSVYETALVPGMVAAAVVLCFLLLLGLFIILCMYRRKHQGGVGSPCPARTVAMGSFLSVPLQCCAGSPSTPSEVLDADSSHLPSQSSKEENNIHYADLQPLPPALWRGRSPGTAPTEYASLRAAAK